METQVSIPPHLVPGRQFIDMPFDPEWAIRRIERFMKRYAKQTLFNGPWIIGSSGGLDSTTVIDLAVTVFGPEKVVVALVPYGAIRLIKSTAMLAYAHFGIPQKNVYQVNIRPAVDGLTKKLAWHEELEGSEGLFGDIITGERVIALNYLAKLLGGQVLGTKNRTDRFIGHTSPICYQSNLEVIAWLYKSHVWQIAKALGVPEEIIAQQPSTGLWTGQTDQGELGASYQEIDQVLYALYDRKKKPSWIERKGIAPKTIRMVIDRVGKYSDKSNLPVILGDANWWER